MDFYCIQIIRDENGDVTEKKILTTTDQFYDPPTAGEKYYFKTDTQFNRKLIQEDGNGGYEIVEDTSTTQEDLKETMDSNIMAKAMEISKGTTAESVQAFFQAFQIRASNPAEYTSEGLIVRYAITGYALNDALDTEAKITDYYNKILIEMDKYREAEISNYIAALAAL